MYLDCLARIRTQITSVLLNSGRSIQHLGKYHECQNLPEMDYSLVVLGFKDQAPQNLFYTGMCLPETCSATMVKSALNFLLSQFSVPLKITQVNSKISHYAYPFDWVFFLTFGLIIALIIVVLLATLSKAARGQKYVGAFALQNSMKTFKYNQASRLNVLNGVRSLAMMWAIFGHEHSMGIIYVENLTTLLPILQTVYYVLIFSSYFAGDAFFFMGGFFMAFSILKNQSKSVLKYPMAIVNRFFRFFPSYLMAILLYYKISMHMSNGPLWKLREGPVEYCSHLWRSIFFVDNLIDNGRQMCMGWGWYLQNDMQMFVCCTLIMAVYSRSKLWGNLLIYLSIAASLAFNMQQVFDIEKMNLTHLPRYYADYKNYMSDVYYKPWGRCPPYLYGLFFGIWYTEFLAAEKEDLLANQHFYAKLKKKFEENKWFRRIFELIGVGVGTVLVMIPYIVQGKDQYLPLHPLYFSYAKLLFVIALSMIILPSLLGINSIVMFLMDTKAFSFIAKISFWTYLIHSTIISQWYGSSKIDYYYAMIPNFGLFVSHTVVSMSVGFIFSLLVEIPFSKLQKMLLSKLAMQQGVLQGKANQISMKNINQSPEKQKEGELSLN